MKFIPDAVTRKIAGQLLTVQKNSPSILFGVGVAAMVGSTVLACRATLKMDEVLDEIQAEKKQQSRVKDVIDSGDGPNGVTYTDDEAAQDLNIIKIRGVLKVIKLYAPAVIVGGIGIACLTKSHSILRDRNAALGAAYIALDTAFRSYRERVIDRYGVETDQDLVYDFEEVEVIDEETGKITQQLQIGAGDGSAYARWFDEEVGSFHAPPFANLNWAFLRGIQNWANDVLKSRGHLFLNEVYREIGLSHTNAGSIVGWVYDRNNERGDNYVSFGCFDRELTPLYSNGREGAILLDFNVDGPIWDLIDERNARDTSR